jgi:hypothetical protein
VFGNLIYIYIHIYKDACGLAQAKGLPSLIYHYHEPAIEVKFMRGAAGTTKILTIRGDLASKEVDRRFRSTKDNNRNQINFLTVNSCAGQKGRYVRETNESEPFEDASLKSQESSKPGAYGSPGTSPRGT